MGPGYFAVSEVHVFQLSILRVCRVLAVVHVVLDMDDYGVFKGSGVVVFLSAGCGAVPLDFNFGHSFAARQG
ncbi:hypothetical protein D3C73_1401440 [compost metagenome]